MAEVEYEIGSGNVFADVGMPDADELFARAELMRRITSIVRQRNLTNAQAADVLGTDETTIADMMRGKLSKFSLERLTAFFNAL